MVEPVVIAGAGVGGLATAIRLQAAGIPTVLVDRNEKAGGKLNLIEQGGYRFDTGPSLVTLPEVFEELFAVAGLEFRKELDLVLLEPYCRYFFEDGTMFETSDSMHRMSTTLLDAAAEDVDAFFTFLAKAARWYRMSAASVLFGPALDWRNLAKSKFDPIPFFSMRPFEPLDRLLRRTFRDERIRRICRLIALYTGCAPDRAPAIFGLIPFLEFGLGRWYIQGGLHAIAEKLIGAYRNRGGRFISSTKVSRVEFECGRARRVHLDSGETIEAAHVVSNADVATASRTFLSDAPGARRMQARLEKLRPSTSAFVLHIGARLRPEKFVHHNIVFSQDESAEWREVFGRGLPPSDPTIYLNHPSFSDPSLAPPSASAFFVMVNVPAADARSWDWAAKADAYQDLVLDTLERRALPGLRSCMDTIHRRTPLDFADQTYADRGSLYGKAPDSLRAMMKRPRNVERGFDGVSFVGGTTHPGAGIPLAALSGKLVADQLIASAAKPGGSS